MRVLLTGACGFIGAHVLAELLAQNIPVAIILRNESNTWRIQPYLDQVTIIQANLAEMSGALPEILKFSPDTLINLAWYGVENKYSNDNKQLIENLTLVQSLFDVAKKAGINSFIGTGSQAEYGPRNAVINEEMVTLPSTLYGVAKLSAYHMLKILCEKQAMRFAWLRIFSSYGPMDNPDWFIPYLITQIRKSAIPKLTKGEQLWDYIYVQDVANAIIAVAKSQTAAGIFNLGSGEVNTVKYLAETIRDSINSDLDLDFGAIPYRHDQVMHLQADITRLTQLVNWQPKVSLRQGIEKTIAWFKSNE